MAHRGRYTRVLVGSSTWAYDFSGVSNSLEMQLSAERLDDSVFQSAASTVAGDTTGTITQAGYAVLSANEALNFEKRMSEALANDTPLTVAALYMTDLDACPAYVARSTNPTNLETGGQMSGLITIAAEWSQGAGIVRAKRVWAGTIAATGAQSGPAYIDLGAAGADGGYAWLFVQSITGAAVGADVLLQSDDNTGFSSPTTKGLFSFSGAGVVEVALTGTVDRYVRLSTTDMGGATNFMVTALAAVKGVTY